MIQIQNEEIFGREIADALVTVDQNTDLQTWKKVRWTNAIAKAAYRIQTSGTFMDWDGDADRLLIWSDSNEIYELNGNFKCTCKAATQGYPCWHKAAKRLIERYNAAIMELLCSEFVAKKSLDEKKPKVEIVRTVTQAEMDSAPLLKPANAKGFEKQPEFVGRIKI